MSTYSKLMIVDGNALVHRAFHALPPTMTTRDGQITNAAYGFTAILLKALKDIKPNYAVLTFDEKAPTFRHKQYKEYKATRIKQPDELYEQIPLVKKIVEAFNIPIFSLPGYEADDLIGTINRAVNGNIEKIILTGDMDTLQLIDAHTRVYAMSRGISETIIYDIKQVRDRFSLSSDQMIDYKALRGDPSDNIPGVTGIGEKTATKLLTDFESLKNIYHSIETKNKKIELIKPRVQELLIKQKEQAFLSQSLATINCESPIEFDLNKARFGDFKIENVINIFNKLEFGSLINRVKEIAGHETKNEDKFKRNRENKKYKIIAESKAFQKFFNKLKTQKHFAFDIEATSKDALEAKMLGISFSWSEGEAYYLEMRDKKNTAQNNSLFTYQKEVTNFNAHPWLLELKKIFENENILKSGHNIKYDIEVLNNYKINVRSIFFDTRVASYLLDPGSRQHKLDALAFSFLNYEKITKKDLLGSGKSKIDFTSVNPEKLGLYSCEDADMTWKLIDPLKEKLQKAHILKLFQDIEMPLIKIIAQMEANGIKINIDYLTRMEKTLSKKIEELTKKIYTLSGESFNINSTQQLQTILYNKLNLSTIKIGRTKTGLSTAAEELNKLYNIHPIIPLIQEYREIAKLLNTYIKALPQLVKPQTGRIHTSFSQTTVATGRLSSQNPNLQNIPVRTNLGRAIRCAFIASDGYKLVSIDYSQIELRLAAHLSDDPHLIDAFKNGEDIHRATAAAIHKIPNTEITDAMRRDAKAINFGILYGQGARGLSETAHIPYDEAKKFIEQYFSAFPSIQNFIAAQIEKAKQEGFVETILGRRRYLPDIHSNIPQVKKGAERMAINTPLQGSAADLIKVAMIDVTKYLKTLKINNCKMLIQVHDELLFEIKEIEINNIVPKIKTIMENVIKLNVPIVVDVEVGDNWGEMEKIKI